MFQWNLKSKLKLRTFLRLFFLSLNISSRQHIYALVFHLLLQKVYRQQLNSNIFFLADRTQTLSECKSRFMRCFYLSMHWMRCLLNFKTGTLGKMNIVQCSVIVDSGSGSHGILLLAGPVQCYINELRTVRSYLGLRQIEYSGTDF